MEEHLDSGKGEGSSASMANPNPTCVDKERNGKGGRNGRSVKKNSPMNEMYP